MGTHNPQTYRFFLMTIDPVHVGTGGARLGRVDNPIVREPGTNLPKIPGSSLHGVIRTYAAHRYGKPQCAGQGQKEERKHCGRPTCPICYTFGSVTGERSYAGVVAISDARILLFPVYSMVGPVWVTSPTALFDAGFGKKEDNKLVPFQVQDGMAKWVDSLMKTEQTKQDAAGSAENNNRKKLLNLGWLMVEREGELPNLDLPTEIPEQIRNRVVLVSDKLFSQIVNSNLEVRTSVAINPATGAAEEGALFTYEAIPRATVLWMDVVVSDYRRKFPDAGRLKRWESILSSGDESQRKALLKHWGLWKEKDKDNQNAFNEALARAREWLEGEKFHDNDTEKWRWERDEIKDVEQSPKGIVVAGLEWAEHLGVGGMGTRGFGRVKQLCLAPVQNGQSKWEGGTCTNRLDAPQTTKQGGEG